ncbi:MAG: tetratricopeptide repeat protein [Ferruginibacter sp.]
MIRLNNNAMALWHYNNNDSFQKAILFLDSATNIDSNALTVYWNKLAFLFQLKKYDKAITAVNSMIRIKPLAQDLYFTGGMVYERLGDTISANNYFKKTQTICSNILDTMNSANKHYNMLFTNKAVTTILLGDSAKGNELLNQLYNKQTDEGLKKITLSLMNKNKEQLVALMGGSDSSSNSTTVSPSVK